MMVLAPRNLSRHAANANERPSSASSNDALHHTGLNNGACQAGVHQMQTGINQMQTAMMYCRT